MDVSELLTIANYSGSDPIADGYITAVNVGENSLEVSFDPDGLGQQSANPIAILETDPVAFQDRLAEQLIVTRDHSIEN